MNSPKNLLDKAIEYVAPRVAAKRMQARMAMALAGGGYIGAGYSRPALAGWAPRPSDAETDTNYDLPALRARSRDLARNAPLATGAINTMVTNTVGTGLSLQPTPDGEALGMSDEESQAWADATAREYRLWSESTHCDVTRAQNFYGLQNLAFRSVLESGDALALLPSVQRPGFPYSTAVQLIEADRICNPGFVADTAAISGGVETDAYGGATHYHVCRSHPGALIKRADMKWDRIPAFGGQTGRRNVIHLFDRRRPGQMRGVPILAPVIEPLKQLQRYTEAELQAAVISGMFAVFVKMDTEAFNDLFDTESKNMYIERGIGWDGTVNGAQLDGSGKVVNLLPGEDVSATNPGRPNALFDPFVQAIVRQIGVALELPFEVLVKHFQSSYSAARAALLDAWRVFRCRRDWMTTYFCQPIYETWLAEAVALGRVRAPGFFADEAIRKAWCGAVWTGDGPGSIDPVKDVTAAKERIALGISTRAAESVLHDGVDWRTKHKQLVEEEERRREDGLTPISTDTPSAPVPNDDEHSAPNVTVNVAPAAVTANITTPPVSISNHLPEPVVQVEAVMPSASAPVVHLEAVMPTQPAPVVHVEPTPVTLEATVVAQTVPAQVVVQHPVRAIQTVERDGDLEILQTVTQYEYAIK